MSMQGKVPYHLKLMVLKVIFTALHPTVSGVVAFERDALIASGGPEKGKEKCWQLRRDTPVAASTCSNFLARLPLQPRLKSIYETTKSGKLNLRF